MTRWLYTLFTFGLLLVVVGIFHSDVLVLAGFALMLPAPTLGLIAAIERKNR